MLLPFGSQIRCCLVALPQLRKLNRLYCVYTDAGKIYGIRISYSAGAEI